MPSGKICPRQEGSVLSCFLSGIITPLCYFQTSSESCYPHSTVLVVSWEMGKKKCSYVRVWAKQCQENTISQQKLRSDSEKSLRKSRKQLRVRGDDYNALPVETFRKELNFVQNECGRDMTYSVCLLFPGYCKKRRLSKVTRVTKGT